MLRDGRVGCRLPSTRYLQRSQATCPTERISPPVPAMFSVRQLRASRPGDRRRDRPRTNCRRPSDRRGPERDPGPQCAFEVSMIDVSCNSH